MKEKKILVGIITLFILSLFSPVFSGVSAELFSEEMEWVTGDTWNYKLTINTGRIIFLNYEVTKQDLAIIDGVSYDAHHIIVTGAIQDIGEMPLNMALVSGTSTVSGVIYRSIDTEAKRTLINITADLRGDPDNTLYSYSVSEERVERIITGSRPDVIDIGDTWDITLHESVSRTTVLSGGQFGTGATDTNTSERTVDMQVDCRDKILRKVPAGTFDTYVIHREETLNPSNYSRLFLSPDIKREVLLLEFQETDPITPEQRMELLSGYQVTSAPTTLTALFTWDSAHPGINQTINFDGTLSKDPAGVIEKYTWSYTIMGVPVFPIHMGNGSQLSYNFSQAGNYNVTLRVTNETGAMDTKTRTVTVQENSLPTAIFTFSPTSPKTGDTVLFDGSGSKDTDGTIVSYEWDWNDDGQYDDTGAGASKTWSSPGTYHVTLKVRDNIGGVDTTTKTITVTKTSPPPTNDNPQADFTYTPTDPTDLDMISFTDRSIDPDGYVYSHYWNFGDGTTSEQQHPGHQYQDNGMYTVRLTVTDNEGATDTVTKTLTIRNIPPVASFTMEPSQPLPLNTPITFTDTSTDLDGDIVNWTWSLDNQTIVYDTQIIYTYTETGEYIISLTVTDNDGMTNTSTHHLTVGEDEKDEGIPGFELPFLLGALGITLIIWRRKHIPW